MLETLCACGGAAMLTLEEVHMAAMLQLDDGNDMLFRTICAHHPSPLRVVEALLGVPCPHLNIPPVAHSASKDCGAAVERLLQEFGWAALGAFGSEPEHALARLDFLDVASVRPCPPPAYSNLDYA